MPGVHRRQIRKRSDSLGLKLEVVDSHHVDAGNLTCSRRTVSTLTAEPSLPPLENSQVPHITLYDKPGLISHRNTKVSFTCL